MRFENIKNLKPEDFRRLTGVKLETFKKMVEMIEGALREKKSKGGPPKQTLSS
ncbi:hypothetical protein PRO82_001197 [Candidatus Protochlamydia amoebophila]|nr:hypothetical protein [Candidatus Protochlamydia amoebophila]